MPKPAAFNESDFSKLLDWLDSDRDVAGEKYEAIRLRLIAIFRTRGCEYPEENADETIDRVIRKIGTLAENYQGNPALFFYGVAKRVFLETRKKRGNEELPEQFTTNDDDSETLEKNDRCLGRCLEALLPEQREFILQYYCYEKDEKVAHRRSMMKELGISAELLRLRAFRIRNILQKCVLDCIENRIDET